MQHKKGFALATRCWLLRLNSPHAVSCLVSLVAWKHGDRGLQLLRFSAPTRQAAHCMALYHYRLYRMALCCCHAVTKRLLSAQSTWPTKARPSALALNIMSICHPRHPTGAGMKISLCYCLLHDCFVALTACSAVTALSHDTQAEGHLCARTGSQMRRDGRSLGQARPSSCS